LVRAENGILTQGLPVSCWKSAIFAQMAWSLTTMPIAADLPLTDSFSVVLIRSVGLSFSWSEPEMSSCPWPTFSVMVAAAEVIVDMRAAAAAITWSGSCDAAAEPDLPAAPAEAEPDLPAAPAEDEPPHPAAIRAQPTTAAAITGRRHGRR
jgi:hypothetical protein